MEQADEGLQQITIHYPTVSFSGGRICRYLAPFDGIGKADGYELDAIIGAVTMQKWEIKMLINPERYIGSWQV